MLRLACKTTILVTAFALAFALGAAGCGGDDEVTGPDAASGGPDAAILVDATPAVTAADVCDSTDGAFVQLFETALDCFEGFESLIGPFPDAATLGGFCDSSFADFIGDGTVMLGDYAALQSCRAAIAAIDCATFDFETFTGCDALIQGTIATGNPCENGAQCAGDAFCDTSGAGTCGVCAAQKANGASCTENDQCLEGRCSGATGETPGTCRAYGQLDDACSADEDCAGSLRCDGDTNKCVAKGTWAANDSCTTFGTQCGFPFTNLYCDENAGVCKGFLAVNAPCAAGQGLCNLPAYEYCDVGGTNTCAAPVLVPEGQACDISTGRRCQAGLVCSNPFDGGFCRAPDVGSSCDAMVDDFSCGFLLQCQSDNTCAFEGEHTGMCPAP